MEYEPQVDRMLAALREIPREQWYDSLTTMLFVALGPDDKMITPSAMAKEMRDFANHLIAWADRIK